MLAVCAISRPPEARAFCGFYVGKADTNLFNHASQVVMVRDGDRTVLSLMNDYQGEPSDFALVVPVPEVLRKEQIHVGDRELFRKLDEYSSPRLVEYFDPDPCQELSGMAGGGIMARAMPMAQNAAMAKAADALGVTIEAQYTVGEYDIVILSATQSDGLETWLQQNGYRIPLGAHRALEPYVRQNMRFFVAKVNLKEHQATGLSYLRPIQFAFESPKFMLPIRLGMINAQGPQDLIVYALTRGRPRRDHQLSHREIAHRRESPGIRQAEVPGLLQGDVREAGRRQRDESGLHRVRVEYGMVRSVRGAAALARGAAQPRRVLAR